MGEMNRCIVGHYFWKTICIYLHLLKEVNTTFRLTLWYSGEEQLNT